MWEVPIFTPQSHERHDLILRLVFWILVAIFIRVLGLPIDCEFLLVQKAEEVGLSSYGSTSIFEQYP